MEIVQYHTAQGQHPTLIVKEGTKWLYVIMMATSLRLKRIHKAESKYFKPLTHKGAPYPLPKALKLFRQRARERGAPKNVRDALKG